MAKANGTVKSEEAFTEAENLMKLLLSLDEHEARRLFGRLDSQLIDGVKTWGHSEVLAEGMKHLERAVALRNRMREFIDPAEACHRTVNALVTHLVTNLESCGERPGNVQVRLTEPGLSIIHQSLKLLSCPTTKTLLMTLPTATLLKTTFSTTRISASRSSRLNFWTQTMPNLSLKRSREWASRWWKLQGMPSIPELDACLKLTENV